MSEVIFDSFTLNITPNSNPTWSAVASYISFRRGVRILSVSLPVRQIDEYSVELVDLDLWLDSNGMDNEKEMALSGTLYSTREISREVTPVVITPCQFFVDVDEDEDGELDYAEYDIIFAETFEQAVYALFEGTGWAVRIGCEDVRNFPVVTEMEPILVLNGSKLDMLKEILDMFTPDDLWDQQLSYLVNPFTSEILIMPPSSSDGSNVHVLDVNDAHIEDFTVNIKDITPPQKIYIQEDPSSLFRYAGHFEEFGYRLYEYDFATSLHEDILEPTHLWSDRFEDWELDLDIIASIKGEQVIIGDTVIVDVEETSIYEIETRILNTQILVSTEFPLLTGPWHDYRPTWYKWITTHASNIKARTEYSYIIGPPYDNPMLFNPCDDARKIDIDDEGDDDWWNNLPYEPQPDSLLDLLTTTTTLAPEGPCISGDNLCFEHTLPWTTNQLARDYGAIIIDKDHLPEYITSNEGLRVYRKKVIAIEQSGTEVFYTDMDTNERYEIPAFEDLNVQSTSVTITEERYAYDDEGNLIGVHEHKQTRTATEIIVEDTFKIYKQITEGLTSVITYTVSRRYDTSYNLLATTITNMDADTVTGNVSGPTAVSPLESIEEKEATREELYRQLNQRTVVKLLGRNLYNVTDNLQGVLYISMENLIVEEMEQYLNSYYNTSPTAEYEVAFSSNFLDVRGIIGGYLELYREGLPNRPVVLDGSSLEEKDVYLSGVFQASSIRPFRVDGIAMNWDKEGILTVALAAKQVV